MAYFPNRLMPLTSKEDSPLKESLDSNVRITAERYNLHDQEIRAIEEFLGVNGGFQGLGVGGKELPDLKTFESTAAQNFGDAPFVDLSSGDIMNVLAQLVDVVNNMTDYRGQGSSSGYLHSGQRIVFPEQAHAAFLSAIPDPQDKTISVSSTDGFPRQGIITILNDVKQASKLRNRGDFFQTVRGGMTTVEWIRYTDKTNTKFLNCERGYLGTTAGSHSGTIVQPRETRFNRNRRDFCVLLDGVEIEVCSREFPAWQDRRRFRVPFFNIQGFRRDIRNFLRRYGPRFPLTSTQDPSAAQAVVEIADDLGLLTSVDGTPFLLSKFQSFRQKGLLRWGEAASFYSALDDAGLVTEVTAPEDFSVGQVPVFMGRMSVNHALSAVTRVTIYNIDAIQIIQTADGRVFTFIADLANRDRTLQAISNYQAYFISPATTTFLGNQQ